MARDDKNPRLAALARQYLRPRRMFGATPQGIYSFQKSLAFDTSPDETWLMAGQGLSTRG